MIYDENVSEQLLPVAACFSDLSQFEKRFKKHLGGAGVRKTGAERRLERGLNESNEYAKLRNAVNLQFGEAGCRRAVDGILALLWDTSDIDGTVFR